MRAIRRTADFQSAFTLLFIEFRKLMKGVALVFQGLETIAEGGGGLGAPRMADDDNVTVFPGLGNFILPHLSYRLRFLRIRFRWFRVPAI